MRENNKDVVDTKTKNTFELFEKNIHAPKRISMYQGCVSDEKNWKKFGINMGVHIRQDKRKKKNLFNFSTPVYLLKSADSGKKKLS